MAGTIQLKYIEGIIPTAKLNSFRSQFQDLGIDFECIDISGEPQATAEELLAPIILYLSSDVIQAYLLGIATSTSYDIIKATVISIWKHVSGKSIKKIAPSKETSVVANFDLDLRTTGGTKVKFKLKGDIPDSLKEKCVDKAFELIEAKSFQEIRTGYICLYNIEEDIWEIFNDLEFIRKFVKTKNL